jgi:hypothetical protein
VLPPTKDLLDIVVNEFGMKIAEIDGCKIQDRCYDYHTNLFMSPHPSQNLLVDRFYSCLLTRDDLYKDIGILPRLPDGVPFKE